MMYDKFYKIGLSILCATLYLSSCKPKSEKIKSDFESNIKITKPAIEHADPHENVMHAKGEKINNNDEHNHNEEINNKVLIKVIEPLCKDINFGNQNQIKFWSLSDLEICVWSKTNNLKTVCTKFSDIVCKEDKENICQAIPNTLADDFIKQQNNSFNKKIDNKSFKNIMAGVFRKLQQEGQRDVQVQLIHIALLAENFVGVEVGYSKYSYMLTCHEELEGDHDSSHSEEHSQEGAFHCEGEKQEVESGSLE